MATSRGALKPRRTVPPRTSTTWISMSSPMRIVSPTLRVSVSTCTPPWVLAVRGAPGRRVDDQGRPQVRRGRPYVTVRHGDQAVQLGVTGGGEIELGQHGTGQP